MNQPESAEKRVTWAELFFDLVFVFAVIQVSALLHAHPSWGGLGQALVVFIPTYWAWVGTSVHANTHDVDNPLGRIGIFAVGLCGLFMALAIPGAYHDRGVLYGGAYFALRIVLAALVFRSATMVFRNRQVLVNSFSIGMFVTGPLLLVGGFLPVPARVTLWALAALIDLSVPALARKRLANIRLDSAHLPERFGLFLIIAIGESIVAIGTPAANASRLSVGMVVAVALAFTLACALWWLYFVFAASAMRHSMATAPVQTTILRVVLSYGHLSFIGAIIAVSVGIAEVVAHPEARMGVAIAALLFGGCGLYLATFGYTRWSMFGTVSTTRLGGAAVVLVLLPLAPRLPALIALGALAVTVVLVNLVEYLRVRTQAA